VRTGAITADGNGTTGLVIGAAGGALIGREVHGGMRCR
jgi:hypothetical protein